MNHHYHFFCDHRCWRCPLSERCLVPVRMAEQPPRLRPVDGGPAGRVADVVMASLAVTFEQVGLAALQERRGDAAPPVTEPDLNAGELSKAACDPLVVKAREYSVGSLRTIKTLRSTLSGREIDAADRIEETCITVASKIYRAISSALAADHRPDDLQADANGSAKVALILIEESRQAWRLLRPGQDGAGFVQTLDMLETGVHARFPRALEFVRPGFDGTAPA